MATKDITDYQVCQAFEKKIKDGEGFADSILEQMTGEPPKVCERAMERAEKRGLIESGISLRTGWLTQAGLELLRQGD